MTTGATTGTPDRRTWILERRVETAPLTTNRYLKDPHNPRGLWGKKQKDHRTIAEWRGWAAGEYADRLWKPAIGPVEIDVQACRTGRRGRETIDVEAAFILAKALKDGLTDAKMWPDDDDQTVRAMHLLPHIVTGWYGIRLTIREVEP
jgi:hypothetical protein